MSDMPEEIYAWNVDSTKGCYDDDADNPKYRTRYIRADKLEQMIERIEAEKIKDFSIGGATPRTYGQNEGANIGLDISISIIKDCIGGKG